MLAAIAVGLVVVCVGAVLLAAVFAERWANQFKERWAAELSAELDRPVELGDIDLSLLRGRAEISGVTIGPARHEPRGTPGLLSLRSARLDVGVWRTLASFGTRPHVQAIELEGLRANVVRLPDGSLNVQDVAQRLERGAEPEQPRARDDRARNAVVDSARLRDAEVAFVELAPERTTARIADIDLNVRDAGLRRGGRVELHAAVVDPERNLDLTARIEPGERAGADLPARMRELRVRLRPTRLAPLSPFLAALGRDAGALAQGTLSADVDFAGSDEGLKARALIALAGARFAQGARFDARVDLDLASDADAGRVNVRRGVLQAGDMRLLAEGELVRGESAASARGVTLRSQGLSFDRLRAIYPALDRRTAPVKLRGPFALRGAGEGSRDAQRMQLELVLTDADVQVPERFAKPPGTVLTLGAALAVRPDKVEIARADLQVADWQLRTNGRVQRPRGGARPSWQLRFETPSPRAARLMQLLPAVARSGAALPGTLDVRGSASGVAGRPASLHVRVPRLALQAGRSDLQASFELQNLDDPQLTVDARSRQLELDELLPAQPAQSAQPERAPGRPRSGARAQAPSPLAKADGRIDLRVDRGSARGVRYENLRAQFELRDGRAVARKLELRAFDGDLSLAGSELPLSGQRGNYRIKGKASGLQAGALIDRFAAAPRVLDGTLGASVDVSTAGFTAPDLRETLTGELGGEIPDAAFLPANGYAQLAQQLRTLARVPGLSGALGETAERIGDVEKGWMLRDLRGRLQFDHGAVIARDPLIASTPQGELRLQGRFSTSGAQDVRGSLTLQPEAIAALIGRGVEIKEPVTVPFQLRGTITRPEFVWSNLDAVLGPIARAYAQQQLGQGREAQAVEKLLDAAGVSGEKQKPPAGEGGERGAKQDRGKQGGGGEQERQEQPREPTKGKSRTQEQIEQRLRDVFK